MSIVEDLHDYVRVNAPITYSAFARPAAIEEIANAQAMTETDWSSTLVHWFEAANGVLGDWEADSELGFGTLLPLPSFSIDELLAARQGAIDAAVEMEEMGEPDGSAGEPLRNAFSPKFIPLAGRGASFFFVDFRDGARKGCVGFWDEELRDDSGVVSESFAAFLETVGTCLRSGENILGFTAETKEGTVQWDMQRTEQIDYITGNVSAVGP